MKHMYNNAATIRSMTTGELAEFLRRWKTNSVIAVSKGEKQMMTQEEIKTWLDSDDFSCLETNGVSK